MNRLRHTALVLAALLLPGLLCGQSIPKLKQAAEITNGVFENGVEYFFVANDARKGCADFALIQSGKPDVEGTRTSLRNIWTLMLSWGERVSLIRKTGSCPTTRMRRSIISQMSMLRTG